MARSAPTSASALLEALPRLVRPSRKNNCIPIEVWQERALVAAAGCDRATFVAEIKGAWIGTVTGLANQFTTANGIPLLVAMFVVPSERKQGVAVNRSILSLRGHEDAVPVQLALWIASCNPAATALYERCGFHYTGVIKPHSHSPGLIEKEMIRQL